MLKDLQRHRACSTKKKEGQYLRDSAIMLLKTNVEKMSLMGSAIISMKTKGLFQPCHYVFENTWT
jgi:hypothetical protein